VIPEQVPNHVDGKDVPAASGEWLDKFSPADGSLLCRAARSTSADVDAAVAAARAAQPAWAEQTVVARGDMCREIALALRDRRDELTELVAAETGKPPDAARGETDAAIEMGFFMAGEGRRYYGRTTTASMRRASNRSPRAIHRPGPGDVPRPTSPSTSPKRTTNGTRRSRIRPVNSSGRGFVTRSDLGGCLH